MGNNSKWIRIRIYMREGKRSVGNEEKFNVEIDRKFILVLRTQDKKTTFYFFPILEQIPRSTLL